MYIVSVTSFGDRLKYELPIAIESILNNSKLPDKICVIVEQKDLNNIPEILKDSNIIEFITISENLKGHNKYYYTMKKYPNNIIITIDDDIYYPKSFMDSCIKAYENNPKVINAGRVHKIKIDNGELLPYRKWEWESKEIEESNYLFFTGVGGVVYPPNIFNEDDLNISIIKEYLEVDDIFLNYLCKKKGILVKRILLNEPYKDINILPYKKKLSPFNLLFNNDKCLKKIEFKDFL